MIEESSFSTLEIDFGAIAQDIDRYIDNENFIKCRTIEELVKILKLCHLNTDQIIRLLENLGQEHNPHSMLDIIRSTKINLDIEDNEFDQLINAFTHVLDLPILTSIANHRVLPPDSIDNQIKELKKLTEIYRKSSDKLIGQKITYKNSTKKPLKAQIQNKIDELKKIPDHTYNDGWMLFSSKKTLSMNYEMTELENLLNEWSNEMNQNTDQERILNLEKENKLLKKAVDVKGILSSKMKPDNDELNDKESFIVTLQMQIEEFQNTINEERENSRKLYEQNKTLRAELGRLQMRPQNVNPFVRVLDNGWEYERRDNQLEEYRNRIRQLENEARNRDNTINSLHNQLATFRNRIRQLENEARNRDVSELRNIQTLLQGMRPKVIQVPIITNKDKKIFYKFKGIIENQANNPNNYGVKEGLLREMAATINSLVTKKASPDANEVNHFIQRMTDVLNKLERKINSNQNNVSRPVFRPDFSSSDDDNNQFRLNPNQNYVPNVIYVGNDFLDSF